MKRNFLLSLGVFVSALATAQVVHVDVLNSECKFMEDSLHVKMSLSGNIEDINSRGAIVLTPFVSYQEEGVDMTQVQLNGKYKHVLYMRNNEIRSRMKSSDVVMGKYVQGVGSNGRFSVDYTASIAATDWMIDGASSLQIRCESVDADNEIEGISNVFVQDIKGLKRPTPPAPASTAHRRVERVHVEGGAASRAEVNINYRGSYVAPESDATDERNQRDLNFSLEEAQVMVNVNPQILSLKELFTVAMSHKQNKDKFYHIISTCVMLYPTHPVANLNAASMAIEQGDKEAAKKYLQIAPHESLAYKNCRGAYELMNGNIYEGIRLLKSAKAEGSEEAAYNLELFFKQNK